MAKKSSYLTVTDQFCGAGGSSEGVKQAALKRGLSSGLHVKLALNHWKLAIETHNTNHPDTDHDCTDISACDPRRYPSTDILITSPECTNHSKANGKAKPKKQLNMFDKGSMDAEERSRATMWDVCRFAEYHKYRAIIVENVVDARKWIMFDAWLNAMHVLGYDHEAVFYNSMHFHPCPQSRDRMYIVFWRRGNKRPNLHHTPLAYCAACGKDVHSIQRFKPKQKSYQYRSGYVYVCPEHGHVVEPYYYSAFNCIDWSKPGTLVGGRKKPLSPNTIRRIEYGIKKYWNSPQIITTRYSSGLDCRVREAASNVMPTQTGDSNHGILNPMIMNGEYGHEAKVRDASKESLYTQTGWATSGVVLPFLIKNYGGPPQKPVKPGDPLGTLTTHDHHGLFTPPLIVENYGTSHSRPITDRLPCVTTENKHGLLSSEAMRSFISYYYGGSDQASDMAEAARTFRTNDSAGLVTGDLPTVDECHYRMLLPHEIQIGMAFESSYKVLGSHKEKVKQLGNAVTPPAMEFLVDRVIETLL